MIDPVEQQQMSLEGILSGEKPAPREPVAEKPMPEIPALGDTPLPEQPKIERPVSRKVAMRDKEQLAQGRVRDPETGQYTKIESKPEEPAKPEAPKEPVKAEEPAKPAVPSAAPQQEFTEKEKAFLRAAQEERGKRQELERRLAAMEAAKGPAEPAKTFWDDPEAALKAHEDRIRQEATNARLGMAEFTARQRHPDFDEKVAKFAEIIQGTPGLHQQWLASPDPAEFAYTIAKNHMELQQVGSMEEMRAKIERETEARVRTKIEAELKAKADIMARDRAAIPPSLSDARSSGPANRPVWNGPTPLDSILGK